MHYCTFLRIQLLLESIIRFCVQLMFLYLRTLFILVLFFVSTYSPAQSSRPTITFACSDVPKHIEDYFQQVYSSAFEKLGMDFEIVTLGLARAMQEAAKGRVDGLCGKVSSFSEMDISSDLTKVDTRILTSHIALWSLAKNANKIEELGHLNHNLITAHQRGSLASEYYVKQLDIKNVLTTWSKFDLLDLLLMERVDMIVSGEYFVKQHNSDTKQEFLKRVSEPFNIALYPYLHNKHALAHEKFENALRASIEKYSY